jgi:hypothetical protein
MISAQGVDAAGADDVSGDVSGTVIGISLEKATIAQIEP